MSAAAAKILVHEKNGTGWLTFNNPERRNAISLEMWQLAAAAFERFESDPAIRVVVMRGAGGKAFVSGADISQFEAERSSPEKQAAYAATIADAQKRMRKLSKPLIAMIEGFCMGGGVVVALTADIRIAADNSIYGIPAAKLGLGYAFESVTKLLEAVSPAAAKEMLFTGRRLDAHEALRIGLVNRLAPVESLEQTVTEIADEIALNAPLTIRAAKFAIDQALLDPSKRDMAKVEALTSACFASEDYAGGRKAFMEKRKPVFHGR